MDSFEDTACPPPCVSQRVSVVPGHAVRRRFSAPSNSSARHRPPVGSRCSVAVPSQLAGTRLVALNAPLVIGTDPTALPAPEA